MRFKFCDIAENSVAKRLPTVEDKADYIGLEHLVSGLLSIPEWGSSVPLTGEKLIMKKGDVLFGKRNTYLRRAAIAPHDGLFSAHGMILRPKAEVVDPAFFPFFVNSDRFFEETIKISVGSLSPTVNWKDMKNLEFDLPPLEEQKRLADKLWAAYEVKESYRRLLASADELVKAQFVEKFGTVENHPPSVPTQRIGELVDLINGKAFKPSDWSSDGVPIIRIQNLNNASEPCKMFRGEVEARFSVHTGDLLFAWSGTPGTSFGAFLWNRGNAILNQHIFRVEPKQVCDKTYLLHALNAQLPLIISKAHGGAGLRHITKGELENIPILVPSLSLQQHFADFVEQVDKLKAELAESIKSIDAVLHSLINTPVA